MSWLSHCRNPVSWVDIYGADRVSMGVFIRVGFRMVYIHRWPWNPRMRDAHYTRYHGSQDCHTGLLGVPIVFPQCAIYWSKDIACPCIKSCYGKRRQIGNKTNTLSRYTTEISFPELWNESSSIIIIKSCTKQWIIHFMRFMIKNIIHVFSIFAFYIFAYKLYFLPLLIWQKITE